MTHDEIYDGLQAAFFRADISADSPENRRTLRESAVAEFTGMDEDARRLFVPFALERMEAQQPRCVAGFLDWMNKLE